jgi:hypothetical protein
VVVIELCFVVQLDVIKGIGVFKLEEVFELAELSRNGIHI